MRRPLYIILSLPLLFALSVRAIEAEGKGVISGSLLAPGGAVIPDARIVIQSDHDRIEVAIDEEGKFQAEVPAGVYRVSTGKVRGFAPYKRNKVWVKPGVTVVLNIVPKLVLEESDCVLRVTSRP
jgi:hypothetical protein